MTVGSLFSGIGGFDLGLERAGFEVVWQVENNEACRKRLKKKFPSIPCHYDIKTIDWRFIPKVDLVCGGFPCQPFSLAGKRAGQADDRYLWPEVVRCLDGLRPAWFLGENVPGLINLGLDQVCADLESLGYHVWPVCIPACAVDAPHIRQRVWVVAHANTERQSQSQRRQHEEWGRSRDGCNAMADTHPARQSIIQGGTTQPKRSRRRTFNGTSRWLPEPGICRVAHGIPDRVDRLRGLGNAIVPHIAEALGRMILEVSK